MVPPKRRASRTPTLRVLKPSAKPLLPTLHLGKFIRKIKVKYNADIKTKDVRTVERIHTIKDTVTVLNLPDPP